MPKSMKGYTKGYGSGSGEGRLAKSKKKKPMSSKKMYKMYKPKKK